MSRGWYDPHWHDRSSYPGARRPEPAWTSGGQGKYVDKADFRILLVVARLCSRFGKTWLTPTQKRICELVEQFTGRKLSPRTLSRHVGAFVRDDWLKHRLRHYRDDHGELVCRPSLYVLTRKTIRWLGSLGATLWKKCGSFGKLLNDMGATLLAECVETPGCLLTPDRAADKPPP